MKKHNKVILVLDKLEYQKNENRYEALLSEKFDDFRIYYTRYEDALIRLVRNIPFIGKAAQHLLYWMKSLIYALRIFRSCSSSFVICVNPIVAVFLGLLNFRHKFELVYCGFLFEPKKNQWYYNLRKKVVGQVLKGVKYVVVYAKKEIPYYEKIFESNTQFEFIQYGIDYEENEKYSGELPDKYFFSGGGSNRDYDTLVAAYNTIKDKIDLPLCIATLPHYIQGLNISDISIMTDVVIENFGYVMHQAEFVVLSLKNTDLSAGHQVLLQALSIGVPIIVNDIDAIRDYVNEDNVVFFESGNADDLAKKILQVKNNLIKYRRLSANNILVYKENYTFEALLRRLVSLGD